ncbi:MAG: hypothetical protein SFU86_10485 [Pirellulaceae bacterium]|nr:hypothetical protein [Pirellulaceae bacterium]
MARHEADREDILREATALVERAELTLSGRAEPIVVGFRRDGAASIFFGADPVYQFNAAGQLRRAYVGGRLIKAEQGRLISLRRERRETEVALWRHELTAEEEGVLLSQMQADLVRLGMALATGEFQLVGQIPADQDVVGRVRAWLAELPAPIVIAPAPNVG